MFKKLLVMSLIVGSTNYATQDILKFKGSQLYVPHHIGKTKLFRDNSNNFVVKNNGISSVVNNYDKDQFIRHATKAQMKEFIKQGYISIHKLDNGDFKLTSHVRGLGGGPILGSICYWSTKAVGAIGYGVALYVTGGEAALHMVETFEAIEVAANVALAAGTAAPTF